MSLARTALTLAAVLLPTIVRAADPALPPELVQAPAIPASESLYIAIRGGYNALERTGYSIDSATPGLPTATVLTDYRGGYTVSAAVGYDMGDVFENVSNRLEFEIGFLSNNVNSHRVTTINAVALPEVITRFGNSDAGGTTTTAYGMLNYFLDWNLGRFRPFVGAGVGLGVTNFERHTAGTLGKIMDDGDMSIAWNVTVGLGFQLTNSVTLEIAYRYLRADDLNLSTSDIGQPGFTLTSTTNAKNSQLLFGARMRF